MKFILLIAIFVVMVACGASGNGNGAAEAAEAQGRFMEMEVTPPIEGSFITLMSQDGVISVFDEGLRTRFDSVDGGAVWFQTAGAGSNTNRFENVRSATLLPDGNILVFLPDEGLAKIFPDGSYEHFPVAEIDNADGVVHLSFLQALENDRLLLSYISNIAIMRGAEVPAEIAAERERAIAEGGRVEIRGGGQGGQGGGMAMRVEGGMGGMGGGFGGLFGGQPLFLHDMETGEQIEQLPANGAVSATWAGDFFLMQDSAIMRHGANGDVDMILEGAGFAFTAPGNRVSSILMRENGDIIVTVNDATGQSRIFKYYFDETASINPEQILRVWSLEDNAFVRAAISELWRTHPDAHIVYEVALGDGAMSASDAIRTLNTRLLSGSGPDILILDGTPIESYAGRGMLLDLSQAVDFSDIPENLLAPFASQSGEIFTIPAQFKMPVLMGDAEQLQGIQNLDALAERIVNGNPTRAMQGGGMFETIPPEERAELAFNDLEELFNLLWLSGSAEIISDNQLNTNALREFLAATEAISTMYNLTEPQPQFGGRGGFAVRMGGGAAMPTMTGSLMQYMRQSTNFAAFTVDHLITMQMTLNREGSDFALFPGLSAGAWQASTIAGVSADTDVPDFAMEFMNTLLSVEVQSINHGEGLPITQRGLAQQISNLNEQLSETDLYIDIQNFEIISELQTPALLEVTLRNMIWNTTERLCRGFIDLEGAVREVEQNIRNYLAERA